MSYPILLILLGVAMPALLSSAYKDRRKQGWLLVSVSFVMLYEMHNDQHPTGLAGLESEHLICGALASVAFSFLYLHLAEPKADGRANLAKALLFVLGLLTACTHGFTTGELKPLVLIAVWPIILMASFRTQIRMKGLPYVLNLLLLSVLTSSVLAFSNIEHNDTPVVGNHTIHDWLSVVLCGYALCLFFLPDLLHKILGDCSPHQSKANTSEAYWLTQKFQSLLKNFKHDVRQPLSTINIVSSIGKATANGPDERERFQHIQSSQKAASRLIDQLSMNFDRLLLKTLHAEQLNMHAFKLHDILAPLVEEYRHLASNKGLQLRYVEKDLDLNTDSNLLEQIIRNGLDNAIKYTKQGGVVVGVRRGWNNLPRLEIVDTGSGIEGGHVAQKDKGWGHGSTIIQDLSTQLGVTTQVSNRRGQAAGTIFSIQFSEQLIQQQAQTVDTVEVQTPLLLTGQIGHEDTLYNIGSTFNSSQIRCINPRLLSLWWHLLKLKMDCRLLVYFECASELHQWSVVLNSLYKTFGRKPSVILLRQDAALDAEVPEEFGRCAKLLVKNNGLGGLQVQGLVELLGSQVNAFGANALSGALLNSPKLAGSPVKTSTAW